MLVEKIRWRQGLEQMILRRIGVLLEHQEEPCPWVHEAATEFALFPFDFALVLSLRSEAAGQCEQFLFLVRLALPFSEATLGKFCSKNADLSSLKRILDEKFVFARFPSTREAMLILALSLSFIGCDRIQSQDDRSTAISHEIKAPVAPATALSKIDFSTQIKPILQARCQPCHFAGGSMYQRLPFDRPETIKALGTKLFSRIEDERERRAIRDFLSQR